MKRDTRELAASLAMVFAVKLTVLLQLGDHPLLQPTAAGGLDSQYYLQLAQRVAGGDLLLAPGLYFVSPLYIYFLATLLKIGGGSLFFVKLVQMALGAVACALVWLTAREWFSERAAWVAMVFTALTGVFTFYEVVILQAALDPFLSALDAWVLTLALRRHGWRWPVLAGAVFGIHALNRPNMLLVAGGLACAMLLYRRARPLSVFFVAGIVLALLPLSVRNVVAAGTLSPTPSHGGLNLYIGNNPHADGTYHSVEGITPNIAGQAEDARRVAEQAEGGPLSDSQVSAYFTSRALAWWRAQPGAALGLFVRKVAYTLNDAWLTLNYSYPFYRAESAALRWLFVGPLLLVPLGIAGLFSHSVAGTRAPHAYVAWAALVPLVVVSIAVFFVASRYRVPLLMLLCVTSGGLLDAVWTAVGSRRATAIMLLAAALVALTLVASADYGLDDGSGEEETQMALSLIEAGEVTRAATYIARAQVDHPDPGRVHLRLGEAFVRAKRPADVITHLEAAHRFGRQDPQSTYDLAVAYGQEGRTEDAS
ncbi:MAG: glycosyltransferase family 39 protein, partial [Acidobacteriota bacterium]